MTQYDNPPGRESPNELSISADDARLPSPWEQERPPGPWEVVAVARRARYRTAGRWAAEALLLLAGYFAYGLVRGAVPGRHAQAMETGQMLWAAERLIGLDLEVPLNAWLTQHPALAAFTTAYYGSLHFIVTPVLLAFVAWRARELFVRARTAIVTTTAIALICYWVLPTSPPRLLGPPFVDTLGVLSGPVSALANVDAAFPTLHVAWATWCALVIWTLMSRQPSVRAWPRWTVRLVLTLAIAYPLTTTTVVLATANHYLLDVVAGAAVAIVGWWIGAWVGTTVDTRARMREAMAPVALPAQRPAPSQVKKDGHVT